MRGLLAVIVAAGALVFASPVLAGGSTYVVRSGDSLWLIAHEHGTTPQRLARLNHLSLTAPLPVGLRLRLRAAPPTASYTVRPGDTLSAIGQRFGTTAAGLARTNKLDLDAFLLAGTRLRVPGVVPSPEPQTQPKPKPKPLAAYTVRPGDSLTAIAVRFGTTLTALVRTNRLDPSAPLPIGVRLSVPAGSSPVSISGGGLIAGALDARLGARLDLVVESAAMPGVMTSAVVVDIANRRIVYERSADLTVTPASLEKLPLALATFSSLGPSLRIQTRVLAAGSVSGGVLSGDLVLKGYGDPTLDSAGLARLAAQVRSAGIVAVRGRVVGDESYFDGRYDVAGWKPYFVGVESPPLSALVVDRAVLDGRTAASPASAAAVLFGRALAAAGVRVSNGTAAGTAPAGATTVASVFSPTVGDLLYSMTKHSDNFVADMLLKQLGAHDLGAGTSAAGAQVVRGVLAGDGLLPLGVVDGSGLSRLDTSSARALASLLLRLHEIPELLDDLPVAGRDGTLVRRLVATPLAGRVRAKSGTTDGSSGLAGFLDDRYAFVVVSNGAYVPQASAHALQDAFLLALNANT